MLDQVWRRSADVAVVETEGRVALVNLSRLASAPLVLEGTAAAIWALLDGMRTEAEVVDSLAAEYDAPGAAIAVEVGRFLSELSALGLVELVHA